MEIVDSSAWLFSRSISHIMVGRIRRWASSASSAESGSNCSESIEIVFESMLRSKRQAIIFRIFYSTTIPTSQKSTFELTTSLGSSELFTLRELDSTGGVMLILDFCSR